MKGGQPREAEKKMSENNNNSNNNKNNTLIRLRCEHYLNGVDNISGSDRGLYQTPTVFLLQVQEQLHQSLKHVNQYWQVQEQFHQSLGHSRLRKVKKNLSVHTAHSISGCNLCSEASITVEYCVLSDPQFQSILPQVWGGYQ